MGSLLGSRRVFASCVALLCFVLLLSAGGLDAATAAADRWPTVEQPDLPSRIAHAGPLAVEELGTPVTSVHRGERMMVPNPDGKTYDLLQWYYRDYGGPTHVFIVDLATGEVRQDGIPLRRQIHICGRVLAPDGKLYLATPDWQKGMELYVYDPAANRLSSRGVIAPGLAGETRPMVIGTDGLVYGTGSYGKEKKAGAYQLDPQSGIITDFGPIGPSHAPNGCWGYSVAADNRYVYVASGKVPWHLVAYDRQTKTDTVLTTTATVGGMVSVQQHRHGCTARAVKVTGTDGQAIDYWLYQGRAIPKKNLKEPPPWPTPEGVRGAEERSTRKAPEPEVFDAGATPGSDGKAEIWYRAPSAQRGNSRFRHDDPWKVVRFEVPTYPMPIHRLVELPDGRILGTAGAYEGNFIYDPASGTSRHLGKIALSHYATAILDNRIYMSGYPSSPLYEYDPARPWTTGKGRPDQPAPAETDPAANPRLLARLKEAAGTHKMYAAAVGEDKRIYFGGQWVRDGAGGGLAWWDPKTSTAGGFWNTFSNYQIDYMAAAGGGRWILISTLPVRDATLGKPTPKQGKVFIFDTGAGKLVRELEPIEGARGTGPLVAVEGNRVIGITADPTDPGRSVLYGLDAATGEVGFRRTLPYPLGVGIGSNQQEPFDFRLGPDQRIWTFLGGALVRIDPADTRIDVVGRLPRGGRLAFSGADVYLSGSERLRRIRGARPALTPPAPGARPSDRRAGD